MERLETYKRFVRERHRIWRRRQEGLKAPWTADEILQREKFTNVFRVLDEGSQYLLGLLDGASPEDTLLRAWLYRYTNRPEPWEAFHDGHGEYPSWAHFETGEIEPFWQEYARDGGKLYSPAYHIVGGLEGNPDGKLAQIFVFAEAHLPQVFEELEDLRDDHPARRFEVLTSVPACARFLGMQILTDLGYSDAYAADENLFIVPGPGAVRGAREIWPGISERDVTEKIHWLREEWEDDLLCPTLWTGSTYRSPSLMDVQNTLCEFSKYAKFERRPLRAKLYRAAHKPSAPLIPNHW